jgi:hypothetical protein
MARAVITAALLGALLAGCSDIYYDRRETIALGADDAVAANMAESVVDPWPPMSNNRNIAFNGARIQRAVECYRANRVTAPSDLNPSTSTEAGTPATASPTCQNTPAPTGSGSAQAPSGGSGVAAAGATAAR